MYQKVLVDKRKSFIGENNPNWKGDRIKNRGLHMWIELRMGKPRKCEKCGTEVAKVYDWANKSGEYKRDLADWMRLCRSCHLKNDYTDERRAGVASRPRDSMGRLMSKENKLTK